MEALTLSIEILYWCQLLLQPCHQILKHNMLQVSIMDHYQQELFYSQEVFGVILT